MTTEPSRGARKALLLTVAFTAVSGLTALVTTSFLLGDGFRLADILAVSGVGLGEILVPAISFWTFISSLVTLTILVVVLAWRDREDTPATQSALEHMDLGI